MFEISLWRGCLEEVLGRQGGESELRVLTVPGAPGLQQPTDSLVASPLRLTERSEAPPVPGPGLHLALVQQEAHTGLVTLSRSQVEGSPPVVVTRVHVVTQELKQEESIGFFFVLFVQK